MLYLDNLTQNVYLWKLFTKFYNTATTSRIEKIQNTGFKKLFWINIFHENDNRETIGRFTYRQN